MSKIVQLVDIQPIANNVLQFFFKNVSGKAILQIQVAAPSKTAIGLDAFSNGLGIIDPGATFPLRFESKNFLDDGTTNHSLRVQAVVYTDGSCTGSTQILDGMENEMLGAALETQRDVDILAAHPDRSVTGFDTSLALIGSSEPPSDTEAIKSVSGVALRGIPQSYIDSHLYSTNGYLVHGINISRENFLDEAKTNGLSDMTNGLRSLLDTQIKYLAALREFRHADAK